MKIFFQLFFHIFLLKNSIEISQHDKYHSISLIHHLIENNAELFSTDDSASKYLEKDIFNKNLQVETLLQILHKTFSHNLTLSHLQNELQANYLNDFYTGQNTPSTLFSSNNTRVYKQLNATWFEYCTRNRDSCAKQCLSRHVLSSYKKHWCLASRRRFKRFFISQRRNLSEDSLLNEVLTELVKKNMNNNFVYLKSLADSFDKVQTNKENISFESQTGKDINECDKPLACDPNAVCINTFGSYKCKCKKGFVGDGSSGNCFSGRFCSGKFCRLNGECFYKDNLNGYKCKCMLECLNGGRCVMKKYKYECECPKNVTGSLCNETIQYNMFKQKILENFKDLNSSDVIRLGELIKFVEPVKNFNLTNGIPSFEFVKEFLTKINREATKPELKRPFIALFDSDRIKKFILLEKTKVVHHYD